MASLAARTSVEAIYRAGLPDLREIQETEWKTAPSTKSPNMRAERNDSCAWSIFRTESLHSPGSCRL